MHKQQGNTGIPLSIFISYAYEDEPLRQQLELHLSLLRRQGLIADWHNRQIVPGSNWSEEIDAHLEAASLILLLISPDFLASDHCYNIEMPRALARHQVGTTRVIPVILRPVDWQGVPFSLLQCLPRGALPVTSWPNRDEAWHDVARGIRMAVEELRGSSVRKRSRPAPAFNRQNRERLLKRMRNLWIDGVLEQSLHKAALIALGLQEQPDALANPWHLEVQEANLPARVLPKETRIKQVYESSGGGLLILGEPGAGKTTLLLELAQELLGSAERDDTQPVPVMVNLSSWAEKRASLEDWLVEELDIKYQVPRKLGRMWVQEGRILLLLDGLDEVREEARPACIAAINTYHMLHQGVPLVVSSRSREYFAQDRRIAFLKAVSVLPLTAEQIEVYLASAGGQLETVHEALRTNTVLQELVTTPLMLNVLALTYQQSQIDQLSSAGTREAQQHLIFTAYVKRMFERRRIDSRFSSSRTVHWLSWLARQMVWHSQSTLFIERIQPGWFPPDQSNRRHKIMVMSLIVLVVVILQMVYSSMTLWYFDSINLWSVVGREASVFPPQTISLFTPATTTALMAIIRSFAPLIAVVTGLVYGLIVALVSTRHTEIKPAERVSWSWKKVAKIWGIIIGIMVGLQLLFQIGSFLRIGIMPTDLDSWLILMLAVFLTLVASVFGYTVFLLPFYLPFGFTSSLLETTIFLKPNEGIWRSARHSVYCGIMGLLLVGLWMSIFYVFISTFTSFMAQLELSPSNSIAVINNFFNTLPGILLNGLPLDLVMGLVNGFWWGLIIALFIGGTACIQHAVLRWMLWRRGFIPWRLTQFLDYAAERILLHQVGGGYIFMHRLLQDYFASLETPSPEEASTRPALLQNPDEKGEMF